MESARALLFDKDLPKTLWAEAVNTSVYLLNRTPTKQSETTPYEHWTGKRPNLQHTKVFGCEAYLLTPGTLKHVECRHGETKSEPTGRNFFL